MRRKDRKPHCPFCRRVGRLEKIGVALYRYMPCGCEVQFTAQGYPRKPKKKS